MEFDLEELRRDWIEGVSGAEFYAQVAERRNALEGDRLILRETDPVLFAVNFFAALSLKLPIILANPNWQSQEVEEFEELLEGSCPDKGSILIPTGGTTGGVRLAVHDWQSLVTASRGVQAFLGGVSIDSCCLLPLYHVSGFMQLVRSFVSGGRIRFEDSEVEGYCLSFVPTQLQRALKEQKSIHKLYTLRYIFVGGGPMSKELAQKVRDLKLPVIPVYGMTETAAMCAAIPNEDFLTDEKSGAVPIGDSKFSIDAEGRIRIECTALFYGYFGRDPIDRTNGYLSGDCGHLDEAGRLHVKGRIDRIIITGGEKVDPAEVELVVRECTGTSSVLVVGIPDAEWGQRVVAFIEGAHEDYDMARLHGQLVAKLTSYKIPKQIYPVSKLPFNEYGKIDTVQISEITSALPS